MKALLKKSCPRCTDSSLRTYYQSILALAKLAGRETIPAGSSWLNGALLKKIKALPLHRFKRFSIAGVKALNAYDVTDNKQWWVAMNEATEKYTKLRMSGKRTKREAERWPKDGYASIRKLGTSRGTQTEEPEQLAAVPVPALPDHSLLFSPRPPRRPRRRSAKKGGTVLDSTQGQELDDSHRSPQNIQITRRNRLRSKLRGECCFV